MMPNILRKSEGCVAVFVAVFVAVCVAVSVPQRCSEDIHIASSNAQKSDL